MRFKCLLGKHDWIARKISLESESYGITVYRWVWQCMYCHKVKMIE